MREAALIDLPRERAIVARLSDVRLHRAGRPVLDGINLVLNDVGVTALMGANGTGKSLTLRLLAGLVAPDEGTIWFAGGPLRKHDLALVFQTPVLLRRSVRGNLDHALRTYGVPRADRGHKIDGLLAMAGLSALADSPARRLSGGEQQRLAMVRALAMEPKYLLLDEPTASLDPHSTKAIEDLVRQASGDGVRVILVTHDRGQAARLADEIIFLHAGRVTEAGSAARVLDTPTSLEARAYLAGTLYL